MPAFAVRSRVARGTYCLDSEIRPVARCVSGGIVSLHRRRRSLRSRSGLRRDSYFGIQVLGDSYMEGPPLRRPGTIGFTILVARRPSLQITLRLGAGIVAAMRHD